MRQLVLVLSAVFLLGISTSAQVASQSVPSSSFAFQGNGVPAQGTLFAANPFSASLGSSSSLDSAPMASSSEGSGSAAADPPQGVYGVKPNYPFEGYVGYTFLRFYEVPRTTVNMNGLNFSVVYFPETWIGADGEFVLTLGNQYPYQARFLLGMGGVRVRTMAPFQRNINLWAHVLAGGTHFTPQTAYGGQGAFAYEFGVGVDINFAHPRYALRVSADGVGTTYFGTYQLSPKISVGGVYRF
jgi:hypothetical protein